MKKLLTALLSGMVLCAHVSAAKADIFVWGDDKTGVTLSFPDTWRMVSSKGPSDIVTFMAPSGRAHASCRFSVSDDERFQIYPPGLDWAVQKQFVSVDFWHRYLAQYDDPQIYAVGDGAGLGRGWASFAQVTYKSAVEGPYMPREGLMFASVYNGNMYVLDCSSHADAFADWQQMFRSVAHTVDFRKERNEITTGNYRNFLEDSPILLRNGPRGDSIFEY